MRSEPLDEGFCIVAAIAQIRRTMMLYPGVPDCLVLPDWVEWYRLWRFGGTTPAEGAD